LAHRNRNSVVPKSRNLTIRFGAKGGGGKKSSNGANPFASSDLMALRNKLPSNPDLGQTKKQTGGNDDMVRVSEADVVAAFSAKNKGGSMKAERKGKGGKKSKNETKKPGQIGSGNGSSLGVDPAQQAVRVGVTRAGKKGKTVTVVDGLDVGSADEQKELLKKFKKIIGAGGSVSENGSFSFQGDNAALLVDMLKAMGFKQARQTGGLGVK
jgi:translation initiation factor 1 (eIF-1/SUI1)